jgi:hypothetical protein
MVIESGAPVTSTERANILPRGHKGVALNSTLYLGFALTIAFVVAFGFAQTFRAAVVHPRFPLPWVLYFHIGLFAAWVLLFVTQAAFIRFNRRRWHRRLGLAGVAVAAPIPIVGVATAISMACFHVATGHPHAVSSLAVPFSDMLAFSIAFWLAIYWRRNPSFHARSMLLASCALTAAAFARFPEWLVPEWLVPEWLVPNGFSYVEVEMLVIVIILLDWVSTRRVHPVYGYGLPCLAAIHATAMWLTIAAPPAWVAIARLILQ